MSDTAYLLGAVLAMTLATVLTRALPFLFFARRRPPPLLAWLESSLPPLVMSLLVVASLKDLDLGTAPWGIPSLAGAAAAALLHLWRRNALLSIAGATALYMVLIRVMG